MKTKIVAVLLVCALAFSAFSMTANASAGIYYYSMDYSSQLAVGNTASGTMNWSTPIAISFSGGNGAGKGFTVSLEKGKEYILKFKSVSSYEVLHAINLCVMSNVMTGEAAKDILSTPVFIHEYGITAATAVRFTAPSTGYFKLLVTEGAFTVDDYKMATVNYTVSVSELEWQKLEIKNTADIETLRTGINTFNVYSAELDVSLNNDIDMLNADWGTGIKYFSGKFNGNGYTVSKYGVGSSDIDDVGFFGKVMGNAVIQNLKVNVILATGATSVGALAGTAEYATFKNCSTSGAVRSAVANSGGLVGDALYSTFTNCSSSCTVTNLLAQSGGLIGYAGAGVTLNECFATGNVSGTALVGGFMGTADAGVSISSCYATGNASGTIQLLGISASIGGFIGCSGTSAFIDECYATGSVTGGSGIGGFVGLVSSNGTIRNCYATGAILNGGNSSLNISFGGFAGSVAGKGNVIANCYTISDISTYANRVGGFIGSIESNGQCAFKNDYAAGAITIKNAAGNYGSFLGKSSDNTGNVSTAENCFVATQNILLNGSSVAAPVCLGYNSSVFQATSVNFSDEDAVTALTKSLNDYAAENDGFDGWNSANVKNGPCLLFDASVGEAEFSNIVDWVKSQNFFVQIPLWIFYIPMQYFISLFK